MQDQILAVNLIAQSLFHVIHALAELQLAQMLVQIYAFYQ